VHTTHTSRHCQNVLAFTGIPRISMVTMPSSMASCKKGAFEAHGLQDASSMTLFLPILCTLICVSPCIVRSHFPNWQYPFSLRPTFIQTSPRVWRPFVLSLTIGILRALISPVLLRCGMLCSRKHDYGQLCLTPPIQHKWKYPYSCF
jgi:ABC-type Fe3+ transport system permease subunit